jgi:alpha-1,2-glucosyltransferase
MLSPPPSRARPRTRCVVLFAAFVFAHSALVFSQMRGMGRYSDEGHHLRQVQRFCNGDFSVDPKLTTIPGYHLLASLAARVTGDCSLATLRGLNVVCGILSTGVFLVAALLVGARYPILRALQLTLFPILLPYHFLAYTDSLALLLILVSMALLLSGRPVAAGLVTCASLLVRQTHVAWLVFIMLYVLANHADDARGLPRKLWPCFAGLGAFAVFVIVNGGVALHDRSAHRPGLHFGNLFLCLFLFFFLFLPANLAWLWKARRRLNEQPLLAMLVAAALLLFLGFSAYHPYNHFQGFLHNELVTAIDASLVARAAFFVPVAAALAALYGARLLRAPFYALYAITFLALLPDGLIEHRYYLVPYALFLLFREDLPLAVEWAGVVLSLVLADGLVFGLSHGLFAL